MSWPTVRISEISEIISGATPRTSESDYWDGDIDWATPADLSDIKGAYIDGTPRKISKSGLQSCAATVLPANSVLFSSRAPIGHVAINTVPMATNQGFKSFIANRKLLDPKFLYWWLKAHRPQLEAMGNGATFKEVSKATISRVEIALPPLDEQKRIAAILDKADQLRQKRRQAIALLDSLTQSIFLEMFGEVASLAWPTAAIGEIALDMRTGPFGSQLLHSEFVDAGIAVLGIDNAVNNHFEWGKARFITEAKYRALSRYTVKPSDVLITIMGTCGRCAVVPADIPTAINTKHLCCITLDQKKALPEYLHACFLNNRNVLRQLGVQAKGAVMPGLNMGIIKSLVIPIPPISLQQRFREVLAVVQGQTERAKSASGRSEVLFASLQHRAFSGQL